MLKQNQPEVSSARPLFVGIYALSGAAALLYEITWTRLLTLQMGDTVAAASTVLAAFMGGLALGAWLAGTIRVPSAYRLRAYATLEVFVALTALILPALLRLLLPVLSWAYADGNAPDRFALVRLLLSLGVLGLPTAAMGATFPIAAAWFAASSVSSRSRSFLRTAPGTGMLYAANSGGAALGAMVAGFWSIPNLGLSGTTWIGAGINFISALTALWISRSGVGNSISSTEHVEEKSKSSKRNSSQQKSTQRVIVPASPRLAHAAIALSGFLALAYEVAWTRLLELVIGPTTCGVPGLKCASG